MANQSMVIQLVNFGTKAELLLNGRLDSNTADESEKIFMQAADQFDRVVLNLANMDYISSAGLRIIKRLHMTMKKKNGSMAIKNANRMVMEVFEMTGFVALFEFE